MSHDRIEISFSGSYITAGQFLKKTDMISSGGEVKSYLEDHPIQVNGQSEHRRGRKLYDKDLIEIEGKSFILKGHGDVS